MRPDHKIKKAQFDIRFGSKAAMLEEQASLAAFIKQRLMPIADEVLSGNALADRVIRIDKLSIDLGCIRLSNFRVEMENRFREKLNAVLEEKIRSLKISATRPEGIIPLQKADQELIEYFLLNGVLPWTADLPENRALDSLLQCILRSDRARFSTFLKRHAQTQVIRRLVRQFPENVLWDVVKLLAPAASGWIIAIIDDIRSVQNETPFMDADEQTFNVLIWEIGFNFLLTMKRESFTPMQFVSWLMAHMVRHRKIDSSRFLSSMAERGKQEDFKSELPAIIEELVFPEQPRRRKPDFENHTATDKDTADELETLKAMLVNTIVYGVSSGVNTAWPNLFVHYPTQTRALILHYGKQAHVRKKMVRFFTNSQLKELIDLIEPENADFIHEVIESPVIFRSIKKTRPLEQGVFKKQVWEFTLAYLLVDRGSRFNQKIFTRSVIRELASHYNVAYVDVLATMKHIFQETRTDNRFKKRMLSILCELDEESRPTRERINAPDILSRENFRGYDLYDALYFFLRYGIMRRSAQEREKNVSVSTLIEALQKDHPGQLRRLFNELQDRPAIFHRIALNLSEDLVLRLIAAFFKVSAAEPETDSSVFMRAIKDFSAQVPDRNLYYTEVLTCLANGYPVDFEKIIVKIQKSSSLTKQGQGEFLTPPSDVPNNPDLIRTYLDRFLETGKHSLPNSLSFTELLDGFIENFPHDYRYWLLSLTEKPESFASLLKLTSVRLLNKGLVRPAEWGTSEKCIHIPEDIFSHADALSLRNGQNVLKAIARFSDQLHQKAEQALLDYLVGNLQVTSLPLSVLRSTFQRLMAQQPEKLYALMREHFQEKGVTNKWVALLPDRWLTRVLYYLRPDLHLSVQKYADVIVNACYSRKVIDRPESLSVLKWEFIFNYLVEAGDRPFNERDFIRRFITFLAGKTRKRDDSAFYTFLDRSLAENIPPSTRSEHLALIQVLNRMPKEGMDSKGAGRQGGALEIEYPGRPEEEATDIIEEVVVQNAGMVIASPYLPRLWKMLELTEGTEFKDRQTTERAVHLLEFMTNERIETPEYQLVLNKILCGVKTGVPICRGIDITDREQETIEVLIKGMIANWKTIGKTSVQGFRESFFQRRGRLVLKENAWHLKVEERAFDMLLDRLPWSFATIKHPWMERVVYVKWR